MSQKSVLLISYEYEGYHSKQTTALVKRPRYVAEYLASVGYQVTVLFSSPTDVSLKRDLGKGSLRLEGVNFRYKPVLKNRILQKLRTAYYAYFKGDFSSASASKAKSRLVNKRINYDSIICFFTPRGPLYLGYLLAKSNSIPLIFDFQDPIYEGYQSEAARKLLDSFYKRISTRTSNVSCVSKEWATELRQFFDNVYHIPHAIENRVPISDQTDPDKLVIFYYGSIDFNFQNIGALLLFLSWANTCLPTLKIEFKFAGNEETYLELENRLSVLVPVKYLGWLGKDELMKEIATSDILCLLSWEVIERKGIPSKFYEYCRFDKPILILGEDAGGFRQEFGVEFEKKYIDLKWSKSIKKKEDIVSRLFKPSPEFLEDYTVKKIGHQLESLI
jgi:hypothetical protein